MSAAEVEIMRVRDERDRALKALEEARALLVERNGIAREMADLRDEHHRTVTALELAKEDAAHHEAQGDRLSYALEAIRDADQLRPSRMVEIARLAVNGLPFMADADG